ncbi:hypothetical protein J4050_14425 [Winogradskyella sp. DF17]|uniref:Uncharacterized protein n=1 Tax=Winogradskyella pelagia TaxID=2819984 RepID=A0ABS3T668_9FLAO|nr:hypothetical protein [Winogradskyella sp. DF17]MBO3117949.1 hypothetical protein [Winogradskyella sp. DF17]
MQVTIIFEDLNLSALGLSASSRKSLRKSLKLRISKNLQIYSILILLGILCFLFRMLVPGIIVITISTLWYGLLSYFKNAFSMEIKFSDDDALEEIVKKDLYN